MFTRVSATNNLYNPTFLSFNLSMLTEMDGVSINNEDTKEF